MFSKFLDSHDLIPRYSVRTEKYEFRVAVPRFAEPDTVRVAQSFGSDVALLGGTHLPALGLYSQVILASAEFLPCRRVDIFGHL